MIFCFQGPGYKRNYQIHLKSQGGPINVLLVNKETDESEPVAVQVPPPKPEPMAAAAQGATIAEPSAQNQNTDPSRAGAMTRGKVGGSYLLSSQSLYSYHEN